MLLLTPIQPFSDKKFWIIDRLQSYLLESGLGHTLTNAITFTALAAVLIFLVWAVYVLGNRIVLTAIHRTADKTETKWDDLLVDNNFFSRAIKLIPMLVIMFFINELFIGYDVVFVKMCRILVNSIIIIMIVRVICAFLDAANEIYEMRTRQTIKGYVQTIKVIAYIIGILLIVLMVFNKQPSDLLVGLGASAAIIMLVFKDTILGFVASIQLSAQDMVRKGDWIEIPSKNTDGVVTDINLNSVKVLNWDNTVTMVPIYSLVSEPFTNWRAMEQSNGRRFKRSILIDVHTVHILSDNELSKILTDSHVAPLATDTSAHLAHSNRSGFITNMGLFRSYVAEYLRHHPDVNPRLMISVRYTQVSENGLTMEFYGFSSQKNFVEYERVVAGIFEHLLVMARVFDLQLYERPSGRDYFSSEPEMTSTLRSDDTVATPKQKS